MLDTTPPLLYNGSMKEDDAAWDADCDKCHGFGVMDLGNEAIAIEDRLCHCACGQAAWELLADIEDAQIRLGDLEGLAESFERENFHESDGFTDFMNPENEY